MSEYLAYGLPPIVLAAFIFLSTLLLAVAGFVLAKYRHFAEGDRGSEIIRNAIFGTTAFMLGFAFSLSSARFDARRELLRDEVNSIGTTALRATYLPPRESTRFRSTLADYAQGRLLSYQSTVGTPQHARVLAMSEMLTNRMWAIASAAGHAHPANIQLGLLTQSLNQTIDLSTSQEIALKNHVPTQIFDLLFLLMFVTAFTAGLNLTHARRLDLILTMAFLIIISALIFTVDDLDRPQQGLIRIDLTPLRQQIDELRSAPGVV